MAHRQSEMIFERADQLVKALGSFAEVTFRVPETRFHSRRALFYGDAAVAEDDRDIQHWPLHSLSKALCDHI